MSNDGNWLPLPAGFAEDYALRGKRAEARRIGDAAYDLLAALESCAEWIDESADRTDTAEGQQADSLLSAARAAIAKARGQE